MRAGETGGERGHVDAHGVSFLSLTHSLTHTHMHTHSLLMSSLLENLRSAGELALQGFDFGQEHDLVTVGAVILLVQLYVQAHCFRRRKGVEGRGCICRERMKENKRSAAHYISICSLTCTPPPSTRQLHDMCIGLLDRPC